MAPPAGIDIANRALTLVGQKPISNFDEASDAALVVKVHFQAAVDEVIQKHPWNVATRRTTLAPSSQPPAFDYAYQFQLPPDCLRVWRTSLDRAKHRWTREGNLILSDTTPVSIVYTRRIVDDIGIIGPALATAIVYELATLISEALTGKTRLNETLPLMAKAKLREAKSNDGQEQGFTPAGSTTLIDVRF